MPRYRVHVALSGYPAEVREIECADDGDALMACFALLADWHDVQAWRGERLVGRVTRAPT